MQSPISDSGEKLRGDPKTINDRVWRKTHAIHQQLIDWRRDIHRHPELSYEERRTTALVAQTLRDMGLQARCHKSETGVIADVQGSLPGPTVALRADLDALPIPEESGLPFASQVEGVSHACGHDFHTAMLLGAARTLCDLRSELRGTVRLLFQPAEEVSPGGALQLIERGGMDGVGAVMALHVLPGLPAGSIGVREGMLTATINNLHITIHGRSGHSARPHQAIDPIMVGASALRELYLAFDRGLDRQDPVVLTFGKFVAGSAPNVIPDRAVLEGTLRCASNELAETTPALIKRVLDSVTSLWGASYDLEIRPGYPSIVNDPELTGLLREVGRELVGVDDVHEIARPSMGAEDFSHYQRYAPGAMIRLGVGQPDQENAHLHSSRFDPHEDALPVGSALLAAGAIRWLDALRQS